ncbi:MAG: hypothetical protein AAFN81_13655 [Bacteroidota bacterium]
MLKAKTRKRAIRLCPPAARKPSGRCGRMRPEKPPERPDPAIYSQQERFAGGLDFNWNSPDITTNNWSPWRLIPETSVEVTNLSTTVGAANVLVHLYTSEFGIGMPRSILSTKVVNLPPASKAELLFPLSQAILNGSPLIATHVVVEHPHDAVTTNNTGEQIINGVKTSESGRQLSFTFPVRNTEAAPQQINLNVVPTDLNVSLSSTSHNFGPFEQISLTLNVEVPNSLQGTPVNNEIRRELTVFATGAAGQLIGGLTHIILIDS